MKLSKIALSLATLIACSNALASTDVAFQEVLDRNANPYIAKGDHDNRIFWSAMLKGIVGMRTATTTNDSNKNPVGIDAVLPRANVYMDAVVNDWTMAHLALSFHQTDFTNSVNIVNNTFDETQGLGFLGTRSGIFAGFDGMSFRPYKFVDEAFFTIGNLHRNPAYFRMGLGRVDFGLYDRNEILINYTTLFTETQAIFGKLGFMDASGFFGSVYAFRGLPKANDIRTSTVPTGTGITDVVYDGYPHINNFGASIGYCMNHGHMGMKVVVDWMYNVLGGVNLFRTLYTAYAPAVGRDSQRGYQQEIGGIHFGFKGHYNQFDMKANFITTMKKTNGNEFLFANRQFFVWSAGAGMHFKMGHRPSRFGLGFQMTANLKDAANAFGATTTATGLLKGLVNQWRITADLTSEVLKNVTVGVHYAAEQAYADTLVAGSRPDLTHSALISFTTKVA